MKYKSFVNATRRYLHQMLHSQLLKYYKNKVLISKHKTDVTFDLPTTDITLWLQKVHVNCQNSKTATRQQFQTSKYV